MAFLTPKGEKSDMNSITWWDAPQISRSTRRPMPRRRRGWKNDLLCFIWAWWSYTSMRRVLASFGSLEIEGFSVKTFSRKRHCFEMIKSSPLPGIGHKSRFWGNLRLLAAVLTKLQLLSLEKNVEVRVELAETLNSGGQPNIKIRLPYFIIGFSASTPPPLEDIFSLQQSKTARI